MGLIPRGVLSTPRKAAVSVDQASSLTRRGSVHNTRYLIYPPTVQSSDGRSQFRKRGYSSTLKPLLRFADYKSTELAIRKHIGVTRERA